MRPEFRFVPTATLIIIVALILASLIGCQTTPAVDYTPTETVVTVKPKACVSTLIDNRSDDPLNQDDIGMLAIAAERCAQLYPNNPCLKTLIKFGTLRYGAICGGKPQ